MPLFVSHSARDTFSDLAESAHSARDTFSDLAESAHSARDTFSYLAESDTAVSLVSAEPDSLSPKPERKTSRTVTDPCDAVKPPPSQPSQGRTHLPPFEGGFEVDETPSPRNNEKRKKRRGTGRNRRLHVGHTKGSAPDALW